MTYPPQGGPYGGQQQYPQQQPPNYGGYPPQQYPPQGYGGPPPKKSNTGLIIGISAGVVVLLAALGVTGFVTPGFFRSKDKPAAAPGGPAAPAPSASGPAPGSDTVDADRKAVIDKFVTALDKGDAPGAVAELCPGASPFTSEVTAAAAGAHAYHVTAYRTANPGGGVDADLDGTQNGRHVQGGMDANTDLEGSGRNCLINFSYEIVD